MKIGERIKLFRESRDMSVQQLAQVIGTTRNNLYQIERGEHDPSTKLFIHIVNALQITPEDLLQDKSTLAAIYIFERTLINAKNTLPPEQTDRCLKVIQAAYDVWN